MIRGADVVFQLAVSILLARLLGADGYGVYSLALAAVLLLALPVQSGLPVLLIREVARYDQAGGWARLAGLLRRSNQLVALLAVVVVGVAILVAAWVGDAVADEQRRTFLWALALLPVLTLGNLRGAALRGLRRVIQGQLPESVVRPGLLAVFLAATFFLGREVSASFAMALHVGAALVAFAVGLWLLRRELPDPVLRAAPEYETRVWLRSLAPLTLLAGAFMINSYTDVLLLGLLATPADVGIYRTAISASTAVTLSLSAVNMVVAPHFSRAYARDDATELQKLATWSSRVAVLVAAPAALLLVLWGGPILGLVFGDPFAAGGTALAILAVGQLVNAASGSVALLLNMTGHERDTIVSVGISTVVNVGLNVALIPRYGVAGAAVATAASLMLWNAILIGRVWQRVGVVSVGWIPGGLRRGD